MTQSQAGDGEQALARPPKAPSNTFPAPPRALARDLRRGNVALDPDALWRRTMHHLDAGPAEAAEHVERMLKMMRRDLRRR